MRIVVATLMTWAVACVALAGDNYSLEYAVRSAGGGASDSAHFSMVSVLTTEGTANGVRTSAHYSILPLVAIEPTSGIADWMLFD